MNCPVCNIPLLMADRQGVEINYCPTCRGVWIDRGGLDRIIDRSGLQSSAKRPVGAEEQHHKHDHDRGFDSEGRRRKSFFSDLFD